MRHAGFRHDTSEGAPLCRWLVDGYRVDVMPVEASPLGMNTRWFREALDLSVSKSLGEGCEIDVVSAPVFIATKLEAYHDRGKGDFQASHNTGHLSGMSLSAGRERIVCDRILRISELTG